MQARARASQESTVSMAVPRHVAIIMDGNGRWAQQRGLPRLHGHRAGTENIRRIIESCVEIGVVILTLYAFSTENWRRPDTEVNGLMIILSDVIDRETTQLHENGVQLRHIGSLEKRTKSVIREHSFIKGFGSSPNGLPSTDEIIEVIDHLILRK